MVTPPIRHRKRQGETFVVQCLEQVYVYGANSCPGIARRRTPQQPVNDVLTDSDCYGALTNLAWVCVQQLFAYRCTRVQLAIVVSRPNNAFTFIMKNMSGRQRCCNCKCIGYDVLAFCGPLHDRVLTLASREQGNLWSAATVPLASNVCCRRFAVGLVGGKCRLVILQGLWFVRYKAHADMCRQRSVFSRGRQGKQLLQFAKSRIGKTSSKDVFVAVVPPLEGSTWGTSCLGSFLCLSSVATLAAHGSRR